LVADLRTRRRYTEPCREMDASQSKEVSASARYFQATSSASGPGRSVVASASAAAEASRFRRRIFRERRASIMHNCRSSVTGDRRRPTHARRSSRPFVRLSVRRRFLRNSHDHLFQRRARDACIIKRTPGRRTRDALDTD